MGRGTTITGHVSYTNTDIFSLKETTSAKNKESLFGWKILSTDWKMLKTVTALFTGAVVASSELLIVGHALDYIKTRMQAFPNDRSAIKVIRHIVAEEGLKGFYRGIKYNLFTHSTKGAFRMGGMELLNRLYDDVIPHDFQNKNPSFRAVAMAVSLSSVESLFICPFEFFKTRHMTVKNKKDPTHVHKWLERSTYKPMYTGWNIVLAKQLTSWFSFLVAYDQIKRQTLKMTDESQLTIGKQILIGALAGGINVFCVAPVDTIKTLLQKDNPTYKRFSFAMIGNLYKEFGVQAFYRGFNVKLFRSCFYAAWTLWAMEKMGVMRSEEESVKFEAKEWAIVANAVPLSQEQLKIAAVGRKVIALDGAVNSFQKAHLIPDVVLGDFDSIDDKEYWGITGTFADIDLSSQPYVGNFGVTIIPAKDQDKTDLEKGILFCKQQGATSIVIFNAIGMKRLDHTLGNLGLLRKYHDPSVSIVIHTETEMIEYVKDGSTTIKGRKGDQCAIMAYPKGVMTTKGLVYDGDRYLLELGIQESSCNQLAGSEAQVIIEGEALVIHPLKTQK